MTSGDEATNTLRINGKTYIKSLRPTNAMLSSLKLKEGKKLEGHSLMCWMEQEITHTYIGKNTVTFVVSSSIQGTQMVCFVYFCENRPQYNINFEIIYFLKSRCRLRCIFGNRTQRLSLVTLMGLLQNQTFLAYWLVHPQVWSVLFWFSFDLLSTIYISGTSDGWRLVPKWSYKSFQQYRSKWIWNDVPDISCNRTGMDCFITHK